VRKGRANPVPDAPFSRRAPFIPHQPRWFQRLGAHGVFLLERLLTTSLRFQWRDDAGLLGGKASASVIFCVWHNRLALAMAIFRKLNSVQQSPRRLAAMVSASKDGAFLAAVLERFGIHPVRGSTSRRGPQALLELTGWAERGYDLAITPDGPRGPRCVAQAGVVTLAQLTGLPIVPVACRCAHKIRLRSWDAFQIPLPLSGCEVWLAEPIWIPRQASETEREAVRLALEKWLRTGCGD
jgi:lysophospholipid acyltransferase (LPLAT)-like uncharacterized protein